MGREPRLVLDIVAEFVGGPADGERRAITSDQLFRGVIDFPVPAMQPIEYVGGCERVALERVTYRRREPVDPNVGLALQLWHFDMESE